MSASETPGGFGNAPSAASDGLFAGVVGQDRAVAQLRAAARAPVHAYLFVGPPGSGKRAAARAFAAALLCERGGCGECRDCRLALAEAHPDLTLVERVGAYISVEQAERIIELDSLAPVEGRRKVIVPVDFHLVREVAPKLLKTIEEPAPSTVFVVLADDVPRELVTIASRCVRIDFRPLVASVIAEALVAQGADPAKATEAAEAAGGRLDRARLLVADHGFSFRHEAWRNAPARLDGTGASAAVVAAELLDLVGSVLAPLQAIQADERADLEGRLERYGDGGRSGAAQLNRLDERHKREQRRLRADELRFGLATLQAAYRDAVAAGVSPGPCLEAIGLIHAAAEQLVRNPNEVLLLQALFVRIAGLGVEVDPRRLATVKAPPE